MYSVVVNFLRSSVFIFLCFYCCSGSSVFFFLLLCSVHSEAGFGLMWNKDMFVDARKKKNNYLILHPPKCPVLFSNIFEA